jgi:hypothetical protein
MFVVLRCGWAKLNPALAGQVVLHLGWLVRSQCSSFNFAKGWLFVSLRSTTFRLLYTLPQL